MSVISSIQDLLDKLLGKAPKVQTMDPKTLEMHRDLAVIIQGNAAKGLMAYLTRRMDQDSLDLRTVDSTDAPRIAMLQGRSQRVLEIIGALQEAPAIVAENSPNPPRPNRPTEEEIIT